MQSFCLTNGVQCVSGTSDEPGELIVHPVDYSKCLGKTVSNKQCCNKPYKASLYCCRHRNLFKYEKPDDCPVCTESLCGTPQPLSCGHWVHRSCVVKWKDECPVCRSKIRLTKKERSRLPTRNNFDFGPLDNRAIDEAIFSFSPEEEIFAFSITDDEDISLETLADLAIRQAINNLMIRLFPGGVLVSDEPESERNI